MEYKLVMIYIIIAGVLSMVILGGSYILGTQKGDTEKESAYECGFEAFSDARNEYDVRYYLVAMLFIIFDLEASYLFPWGVTLGKIGEQGYWVMIDFIIELTVGYIYAWRVGALEF